MLDDLRNGYLKHEKKSRRTQDEIGRVKEMKILRFLKNWTLSQIGEKYGITRERVRQLIGNTGGGYRPYFLIKEILKHKDKNNAEVAEMLGISENRVSHLRSKYRHAMKPGAANNGRLAEEIVSKKLIELGIENKLMPHHHPFDILAKGQKRIEIKSRFVRSDNGHSKTMPYQFNHKKYKKGEYVDFIILYIWETEDFFVIPFSEIRPNSPIVFCWPPSFKKSKWHAYHNRFDLLE